MRHSIAFIGMRGAGKSTVGRLVAQALGLPFLDTDEEIERRAGKSIADIFVSDGEIVFRRLEAQAIESAMKMAPLVVAVGGGAVMNVHNATLLRDRAFVVWLRASLDVLRRRISADPHSVSRRPALTTRPIAEEIQSLAERRESAFAAVAHLDIDTTALAPGKVVETVLATFHNLEGGGGAP